MRILHVIDSLQIGGTEGQCLSLVRHLDRAYFCSLLLCLNRNGPLLEQLRNTGLPLHIVPFPGFRRSGSLNSILRLVIFMRQYRVEIVQAYGFYSNVPATLAGRLAGVPIIVASRRDMGESLTRMQHLLERWMFRLCDRVVVNAGAIRDRLISTRQVRKQKIVLIPNGVEITPRGLGSSTESGHDLPEWAGKGKVVGMVAKFRKAKDHTTFLQAAQRVLAVDPTVVFVLVGDGYLKDSGELLAKELGISSSVWFLGAIEPGEIRVLLQHVDISALASKRYEGIPNAVLEYMAAGKPVVATDAGGCREAVLDGITGFLVPPEDPGQFAERILWLLRNDSEAARMGKAGQERVEAEFAMPRMIHQFSSLYENLGREKIGRTVEAR